jgi:hypothetical protein
MSKREELEALRAEVAELRKDLSMLSETLSIHLASCWQSSLSVQFANPQRSNAPPYVITGGRVVPSTGPSIDGP